ncbi:MAG: phosphocarrier protein HPr [Candidatus Hepatoplasma vulgare]|nr:MAG: phosphocarrier protein HPr [Candidatus Hepatoplasma sp.]
MEIKVKITDPIGLHARPATILVKEASKYKSDIKLKTLNGKEVNLKSILSIMSLSIKKDDEIIITAKGSDEKTAIENIEKVMKEEKLIS